jgi:hypothetical protein
MAWNKVNDKMAVCDTGPQSSKDGGQTDPTEVLIFRVSDLGRVT